MFFLKRRGLLWLKGVGGSSDRGERKESGRESGKQKKWGGVVGLLRGKRGGAAGARRPVRKGRLVGREEGDPRLGGICRPGSLYLGNRGALPPHK